MKKLIFLSLFTITLLFSSCKSDKDKINEASQVVEAFAHDIELENYESVHKTYPDFSLIGRYWKLNNLSITETKIADNIVTIYCSYNKGKNAETVMFTLKAGDDGKYLIEKSKGLSGYMGSALYRFCKHIGCLIGLESDVEISEACARRENFFAELVGAYKQNIERGVKLENHNVSNEYGFVSGNVSVKNNTALDIPAFSYDLYIILYDNNYNEIFRTKTIDHVYPIPAFGSISSMIHEQSNRGMSKIGVEIKITDISFLENKLSNPPDDWTCDFIDAFVNGNIQDYIRNNR